MDDTIKIVIGSWGSYNECNERALGSHWLDLSEYSDWEEIEEELKKEGFDLDGLDEELFIQDIEGLPCLLYRGFSAVNKGNEYQQLLEHKTILLSIYI